MLNLPRKLEEDEQLLFILDDAPVAPPAWRRARDTAVQRIIQVSGIRACNGTLNLSREGPVLSSCRTAITSFSKNLTSISTRPGGLCSGRSNLYH